MQEGLCVFVPCSIVYPWPYWSDSGHGSWHWEGATSGHDAPLATNTRDPEVQEETGADPSSMGIPGSRTAPRTSETPGGQLRDWTISRWRENVVYSILAHGACSS